MNKRSPENIKIINEAKLSLSELENWIRELFLGVGTEKFRIPEDVFELGFGEMTGNYKKAENARVRQLILTKILHTREVVEAGVDIIEATGDVNWDQYHAGTVCFLHDVARFRQAHFGNFGDAKTGFDHGEEGAKIIENHDLNEMEEMGISKESVVEAVRWHNKLAYLGDNPYAKLARDADKLGLLRYMKDLLDLKEIDEGGVTPEALERYRAKKMVLLKDMRTRTDVYLTWLSWEYDFNFEATQGFFEVEGIKDWITGQIRERGVAL